MDIKTLTTQYDEIGYTTLMLPEIDAFVKYQDKTYTIVRVTYIQEVNHESTATAVILEIDDEGEEIGVTPITTNISNLIVI